VTVTTVVSIVVEPPQPAATSAIRKRRSAG
jgi:hypothetical protein